MATATRREIRDDLPIDERPIPEGWHRAMLDMSPEAYEFLERLVEETGASKAEVIGKALGLYTVALKARREGKLVGAAGDDQEIDVEFVGF